MIDKVKSVLIIVVLLIGLMACNGQTSTDLETSEMTTITQTEETSEYISQTSETTSEEETLMILINFETNQGQPVSSILAEPGQFIDLPSTERQGYLFLGWSESNHPQADMIQGQYQADTEITLYAQWQVLQFTISFETNQGISLDPITQDFASSVQAPIEPFKNGYEFMGWFVDQDLTQAYTFTTMPAENITLYAKWQIIDWTDAETYLDAFIPEHVSSDITLPTSYSEYVFTWTSNQTDILSAEGIFHRPYQASQVTLSVLIAMGDHEFNKDYDLSVDAYKSLSAPLASSYIYRDYHLVTDAFFDTLDIINCAFITANSAGTLTGSSVLSNINTYIMPKAREHGNWVIFSVGPSSDWSAIASSDNRINIFADNIVDMINTYGFDGVDIDWETPSESEAQRFTELMRVIYTKVKANNPNHLVTAAVAGGIWQPPKYDLENSHQYLDYINMMTYGMVSNNGYYQNALSRSTTFANPTNEVGKTLTSCSIEESVAIYNGFGVPNEKIIVGVAFYGIKQSRTFNSSTQTWSTWANAGSVSYTSIASFYLNSDDYTYQYDARAGVPYIIKNDGSLFISFDNPRSIADKGEYIIDQGLAGMMYWENGHDSTGTLLMAMDNALNDE